MNSQENTPFEVAENVFCKNQDLVSSSIHQYIFLHIPGYLLMQ